MQHRVPEAYANFESALHDAARSATGLEDFGRDDYLPGLRRLIDAYRTDLPGDRVTRETCFAITLPGLVGRLHSERGWAEHPDCLARPIERPLIIAGIPRTGTTALHKLLSMDPRFQGLENWIIPNPIVRPARETWQDQPLYLAAVAAAAELVRNSPGAAAAHGIGADDVDECLALMMQSFVTNQIPSLLDLPSYDDWYLAQDEASSYRRLADNLRLIGYAEPEKTWLLKNPTHLLRMGTLLREFPDARIIHTHREPVATVLSMCSMLSAFRGEPEPGSPAARAIGPRQLRVYKIATERTMAVRERSPNTFHDVHQAALRANPMQVVREIYQSFALELEPDAERRMRRFLEAESAAQAGDHPVGKPGGNPIPLESKRTARAEDFGLTEAQIRSELAPYIERYGLA